MLSKIQELNSSRKRGWILIYVLVICSVITLMIFNILGGRERKNSYYDNYIGNLMKEDLNQKKKEYLMTEFHSYFQEYRDEIKERGIDDYFKVIDISSYLRGIERDGVKFNDQCNIKYNSVLKLFELNVGSHIYRFYPIIGEEHIRYKFVVLN